MPFVLGAPKRKCHTGACRTMIGIRDRSKGTLKLLPAAGLQVVRLQARLHDVPYDDAQLDAADTSDIAKRVALANNLARNFGSSRRC